MPVGRFLQRSAECNGYASDAVLPVVQTSNARARSALVQPLSRSLRALPKDDFLLGWHAVLLLFPDLHPEGAIDHGTTTESMEWLAAGASWSQGETAASVSPEAGGPGFCERSGERLGGACGARELKKNEIYGTESVANLMNDQCSSHNPYEHGRRIQFRGGRMISMRPSPEAASLV
jgi:hypothetical protein